MRSSARPARAARLFCLGAVIGLLHLAATVGMALKHFQIDFGVDLGERIDTASLSVIYTPGG